jgi:hypothetical protein
MFGRYDNKVFVRNRYECVRRSFGRLRNAVSLTFPDRSAIIKTNDSPDAQTVCVGQPTEGYLEPVRLADTEAVREFITGSDKPVADTRSPISDAGRKRISDILAGAFRYANPNGYRSLADAYTRLICDALAGDECFTDRCPDCDSTSQYRSVVL